ncbi:hypothetical protein [Herbiconiux sp. L3-i23]|uniref:hypothetical protein n=1 Tax=Herbiconiux sp. L3-i23 TaxID=2905871 RepID=UPI002060FE53|nr:hypothetical protein [Herbiconiux sp. L3-i23]BDI22495.1 hypothetical protein L3i23_12710 [Herbiconiux sp. L3-i23]
MSDVLDPASITRHLRRDVLLAAAGAFVVVAAVVTLAAWLLRLDAASSLAFGVIALAFVLLTAEIPILIRDCRLTALSARIAREATDIDLAAWLRHALRHTGPLPSPPDTQIARRYARSFLLNIRLQQASSRLGFATIALIAVGLAMQAGPLAPFAWGLFVFVVASEVVFIPLQRRHERRVRRVLDSLPTETVTAAG